MPLKGDAGAAAGRVAAADAGPAPVSESAMAATMAAEALRYLILMTYLDSGPAAAASRRPRHDHAYS